MLTKEEEIHLSVFLFHVLLFQFCCFTAPFSLILLSNLFIAFKAKLLTHPGKLSLAKKIARSVISFLHKMT